MSVMSVKNDEDNIKDKKRLGNSSSDNEVSGVRWRTGVTLIHVHCLS